MVENIWASVASKYTKTLGAQTNQLVVEMRPAVPNGAAILVWRT